MDLDPAPGRHPIRLSDRWYVVVLEPLDGRLVLVIDEPAGLSNN